MTNARHLWDIAGDHIPADVIEFADRHKMRETISEIWRSAFMAGWRAAKKDSEKAGAAK